MISRLSKNRRVWSIFANIRLRNHNQKKEVKSFFQNSTHYRPPLRWVMKCDDDVYVRVNKMEEYLKKAQEEKVENGHSLVSGYANYSSGRVFDYKRPTVIGSFTNNHREGRWVAPDKSGGGGFDTIQNRYILHSLFEFIQRTTSSVLTAV